MNIEFPALYHDSDNASLRAQRAHFLMLCLQLIFLFVVSVGAGLRSLVPTQVRQELVTATAIALAGALLLTWVSRYKRYEKVWFGCRAIAESVKSATWLYVMHVPPFDEPNPASADRTFTDRLREILNTLQGVESYFTAGASSGSALTEPMRHIRGLTFEEKKSIYVQLRLSNQRTWYKNKCRTNRSKGSQWFWMTLGLQGAALIWAMLQMRYEMAEINLISPLMTLVASFVAWSQAKRYEELAEAYALAAQELDMLDGLIGSVRDEGSVREMVLQAEEAISREHKMWCIRRSIRARV